MNLNRVWSKRTKKKIEKKEQFNEYKINDYITLKLEDGETNIYVNGRYFNQCKFLMLNIPVNNIEDYDGIESIDDAADILGWTPERQDGVKYEIPPEIEFWGHCSNLQAWAENNYDTRLLHSNLAFPLLKKLVDEGETVAKKFFKEEMVERITSGNSSVIWFLVESDYLDYFDADELKSIIESPKFKMVETSLKTFNDKGSHQFSLLYDLAERINKGYYYEYVENKFDEFLKNGSLEHLSIIVLDDFVRSLHSFAEVIDPDKNPINNNLRYPYFLTGRLNLDELKALSSDPNSQLNRNLEKANADDGIIEKISLPLLKMLSKWDNEIALTLLKKKLVQKIENIDLSVIKYFIKSSYKTGRLRYSYKEGYLDRLDKEEFDYILREPKPILFDKLIKAFEDDGIMDDSGEYIYCEEKMVLLFLDLLTKAGNLHAKIILENTIIEWIKSEHLPAISYLAWEGYLDLVNPEEIEAILTNPSFTLLNTMVEYFCYERFSEECINDKYRYEYDPYRSHCATITNENSFMNNLVARKFCTAENIKKYLKNVEQAKKLYPYYIRNDLLFNDTIYVFREVLSKEEREKLERDLKNANIELGF